MNKPLLLTKTETPNGMFVITLADEGTGKLIELEIFSNEDDATQAQNLLRWSLVHLGYPAAVNFTEAKK
ncbi:MAG: hypothetical protein IJG24_01765 [Selenomonadaceae bacterium]|nr:hypothetical protein [Selenomonadaceae bacterium]